MKKLIIIIAATLLMACSAPDMQTDIVISKRLNNLSENRCLYGANGDNIFYADCDCYDVGDSINKWWVLAKQNRKIDSINNIQPPEVKNEFPHN